jgi:hypothetical protein
MLSHVGIAVVGGFPQVKEVIAEELGYNLMKHHGF